MSLGVEDPSAQTNSSWLRVATIARRGSGERHLGVRSTWAAFAIAFRIPRRRVLRAQRPREGRPRRCAAGSRNAAPPRRAAAFPAGSTRTRSGCELVAARDLLGGRGAQHAQPVRRASCGSARRRRRGAATSRCRRRRRRRPGCGASRPSNTPGDVRAARGRARRPTAGPSAGSRRRGTPSRRGTTPTSSTPSAIVPTTSSDEPPPTSTTPIVARAARAAASASRPRRPAAPRRRRDSTATGRPRRARPPRRTPRGWRAWRIAAVATTRIASTPHSRAIRTCEATSSATSATFSSGIAPRLDAPSRVNARCAQDLLQSDPRATRPRAAVSCSSRCRCRRSARDVELGMMRPVSTSPAIEVHGLRKAYGEHEAVRGIDFAVGRGEVFGLLGPNGAGKTTTVEILEGYRTRDGGDVSVLGFDPAAARARAARAARDRPAELRLRPPPDAARDGRPLGERCTRTRATRTR